MIAHVAETGEDRGRVVLQLPCGIPSAAALEAAVFVARAFSSEIEALFVEDEQLFDCANYGFLREISFGGRQRNLSPDAVVHDLRLAAQGAKRQVQALTRAAGVPLRSRVVRDEPLRALSIACAERGPWNVVALAEPFGPASDGMVRQVFAEVAGTTGLVMVGPKARRNSGPIVVTVEDTDRMPAMLHTAERLAAAGETGIVLLLIAPDEERLAQMDAATRLVVEGRKDVSIRSVTTARGEARVVADELRRIGSRFVVCHFGGLIVPSDGGLRLLASALECPLFLVR